MKAAECAICGCDIGRHNVKNDGCECGYCVGFQLAPQLDPTQQQTLDSLGRIAAALERIAAALEGRNGADEQRIAYEDRLAEIRERRRSYGDGAAG